MFKKLFYISAFSIFASGFGECGTSCANETTEPRKVFCFTECSFKCENDYASFDTPSFLRQCKENCKKEHCPQDSGINESFSSEVFLPDVEEAPTYINELDLENRFDIKDAGPPDRGFIDAGHSRCEENCFNEHYFPDCNGDYRCCQRRCSG